MRKAWPNRLQATPVERVERLGFNLNSVCLSRSVRPTIAHMPEIYFAPTEKAAPITLAQLQERLIAAGLPCTVEADSGETHWLVFEPHESTLYVSTTGDQVTLATLEFGMNDDPGVGCKIEEIMDAIGFSPGEEADYG